MTKLGVVLGAAVAVVAATPTAHAFCGFYVSGSGGKMFNDATQVVLMRDGTRTVLSMQNDYKGPLADFAMVIPVPAVLRQSDVKTLRADVFDRVDSLGAPRLVEYWEEDPCPPENIYGGLLGSEAGEMSGGFGFGRSGFGPGGGGSVQIEAKFDVGEYQILILSATDSSGLETWLRDNKYTIPEGAEPLLRPYVESGSKFFVAKVDPKKVRMVNGHAALSPIRFHYDSDDFSLPIRLGIANSSGKQDLIVNILSKDKRYEVANYKNVFIPTNFDVTSRTKSRFAEFYAALFDKTIEANPRAVVTEYAWTATRGYHCDPCPELDVTTDDMTTLGADVIGGDIANNFVLTRLHARYGKRDMKDDLRFKEAKPVAGGREQWSKGGIEYGATASDQNFFQARYAIRHWWSGPIKCKNPKRGVWGGPPDGVDTSVIAASKVAFAPRGRLALGQVIGRDLWEIGFKKERAAPSPARATPPPAAAKVKAMGVGAGALGALAILGLGTLLVRRRAQR
ncbi:MAG: DUF2330 domain-containing protein [Myxococcales bacterium]|nr:DUF2330 domain-containing protein [Myxococcales bacterium]